VPRGKCSKCHKRRNILMEGACRGCLYEELQRRVGYCSEPWATEETRDQALAYMARLTQATGIKVQVPLFMEGVAPAPPGEADTISDTLRY